MKILETQNKEWGFWGTVSEFVDSDEAQKLWCEAAKIIQEKAGFTAIETRNLLDSRWGRHMADEFHEDIITGVFTKAFKKKMTKERLYRDYNYYVDNKEYGGKVPQQYESFCKELEKLSRKYGIVIQAVGGVIQNTNGFQGYNPDLDSGDLIPEWKE
nr:MAG TPA: hypothetical protein [Caudoviricetes sp.]